MTNRIYTITAQLDDTTYKVRITSQYKLSYKSIMAILMDSISIHDMQEGDMANVDSFENFIDELPENDPGIDAGNIGGTDIILEVLEVREPLRENNLKIKEITESIQPL